MMQQTTEKKGKYKFGSENFPILHEDGVLCVYKNVKGEIFIENKRDEKSTIHVTPDHDGLIVTARSGDLIPWAIHGYPAFRVMGRS